MFKALIKKQSRKFIKVLRSDKRKQHVTVEFRKFCVDEEIERQLLVDYTHQQNGISERKNQIVMEMVKSLLFQNKCLKSFS